jgi:hypothetical protein
MRLHAPPAAACERFRPPRLGTHDREHRRTGGGDHGQGPRIERQGRPPVRAPARAGEASKEKAARIANTSRSQSGKKGGKSSKYEEWSKQELQQRAKEVGIDGRSNMNKSELAKALRNH